MAVNRFGFTLVIVLAAAPAFADVWDIQTGNDNAFFSTDNDLLHGAVQVHDLATQPGPIADQDWFVMPQKPYASYEVIVDGVSGDLDLQADSVTRVSSDGSTVLESGSAVMGGLTGSSRALRFTNFSSTVAREYIRVGGAACGLVCGTDDQYTIRVRETTVNVARFNNSGTQMTILITQNTSDQGVSSTAFFWAGNGTSLGSLFMPMGPKQITVFNLAAIPGLEGRSGHITLAQNGGYGAINIKAVALEPATGFTFDTPGVYIPN